MDYLKSVSLNDLEAIFRTTQTLVSEPVLGDLTKLITAEGMKLLDVDGLIILQVQVADKSRQLVVHNLFEVDDTVKNVDSAHTIFSQRAILQRCLQTIDNTQTDPDSQKIRRELDLGDEAAILYAPLFYESFDLGVLLIWRKEGKRFSEHTMALTWLFAQQVSLALQNAKNYLNCQRYAIDSERTWFARQLHDTVSQSLYSIAISLNSLNKALSQSNMTHSPLRRQIDFMALTLTNVEKEVKAIINHQLPPDLLREGLIVALQQHCSYLQEYFHLPIQFSSYDPLSLTNKFEEILYYVAKESLWNVVKHAKATNVLVFLKNDGQELTLSIKDDGIGFDDVHFLKAKGHGLDIMSGRIEALGGVLIIQTCPKQGTCIEAKFPMSLLMTDNC